MATIKLPKSWESITIEQFPLIYDVIKDESLDKVDKEIRIISILSGYSINFVEVIDLKHLKVLIKAINFMFNFEFPEYVQEFKHNGYTWKVNYDVTKLSAGEFISLTKMTATEQDVINNLAEIAAIFVKPYKRKWFKLVPIDMDYEERLKHIKQVNIGIIYPLCVFFCKVLTNLLPVIKDYLEQANEKLMTKIQNWIKQNKISTLNTGDGM